MESCSITEPILIEIDLDNNNDADVLEIAPSYYFNTTCLNTSEELSNSLSMSFVFFPLSDIE